MAPVRQTAGGMTEMLLSLLGVTKTFGGVTALNDVSLSVASGQIGGIIGPNGAGKTTVFNVITGALSVDLGQIVFRKRSLRGLKPYHIARLGIARTFQNIRLFESMTVQEHLLVAKARGASGGEARQRAEELITMLGLEAYRDRPAATLSYGLQRKVEIGRALSAAPQLLLLDEPVAGMNEDESEELRHLLLRLKAQGLTILVIEHDMPFVMRLCDYLYVLDFGSVIAAGPPESVRNDPAVIEAYVGQEADAVG
ncbi:MAG TPA: ABC transporter ATP-binding protein [Hyphomicrobiales bacterium]|nr:ABC transporter ATP-binding protein [Hyphomicrobiales bacterium]